MGPHYANAIAWLSYQLTPRASIFRRDASSVADLASMRHLMRSNSYLTDKVWGGGSQNPFAPFAGVLTCAEELHSCAEHVVCSVHAAIIWESACSGVCARRPGPKLT
jgi:hypothetical protein